jgi:hypothetical protein
MSSRPAWVTKGGGKNMRKRKRGREREREREALVLIQIAQLIDKFERIDMFTTLDLSSMNKACLFIYLVFSDFTHLHFVILADPVHIL